ncbi:MAG: ABC transporter substrate-binding protein [Dehalococcoidia bacterium]|nr:ABC transporter substrate-binding protein [Dehalococcoidia bacterium]
MKGTRRFSGLMVAVVMAVVVALVAVPACAPAPAPTPEPEKEWPDVLKIGAVFSMTGMGAWWGQVMTEGATLAVEHINASGELPFKLELVVGDHKSGDVDAAVSAMRKMVTADHPVAVMVSFPQITFALAPLAEELQIPLLNAGGSAPSQVGIPWVHNTRVLQDMLTDPLLKYFSEDLGLTKLAVLYMNEPGSIESMAYVEEKAPKYGITIVLTEATAVFVTEHRSYLAKVKAQLADIDSLMLQQGGAPDMGYQARQAREMGIDVPICGPLDVPLPGIEAAGEYWDGVYITAEYLDTNCEAALCRKFVDDYTAKFGTVPDPYSALYYEEVLVVRDCIKYLLAEGRDPFDGAEIEAAIKEIKFFPSIFYGGGEMELLPNGGCVRPIALKQYDYELGKYVIVEMVIPPAPVVK